MLYLKNIHFYINNRMVWFCLAHWRHTKAYCELHLELLVHPMKRFIWFTDKKWWVISIHNTSSNVVLPQSFQRTQLCQIIILKKNSLRYFMHEIHLQIFFNNNKTYLFNGRISSLISRCGSRNGITPLQNRPRL